MANKPPMVSVVMPVYNTVEYLEEAVRSILGQTFQDFEFVIVNDGSTDGSGGILDLYSGSDARIHVVHQANLGIAASRNKGIENAVGKYIAVMDSDDVALPERLARQVEFMESHPDVGVCGTRCSLFGDKGQFAGPLPPTDPEEIKCRMLFNTTVSHTSTMMRREPMVEHGLYYRTDFPSGEDFELYTRFLRHYRIAALPEVLMSIRTHPASTTRRIPDEEHYLHMSRIHRQVVGFLDLDPSDEELEAHLSLCTWAFPRTRENIGVVDRWLGRILDANDRVRFYDSHALARVLFDRWYTACALMRAPLTWKWRRLMDSRIREVGLQASDRTLPRLALGLMRIQLSRTLDKSPSGRSLKHLVRNLTAGGSRSKVRGCVGG